MISSRLNNFTPFEVMEILDIANALEKKGEKVIHLEIGEPDFSPPKKVIEKTIQALKEGKTSYTSSYGILDLRKTIVRYLNNTYKTNLKLENIIITPGTSLGLFYALAAILEKDDKVLLLNPTYPCYPNFIRFLGAQVIYARFNLEDIKKKVKSNKIKLAIINSPSNPLGVLVPKDILFFLYENIPLIVADEIYQGLVYETEAISCLQIDTFLEKTIYLNGFSKFFGMTGFRLGYILANPKIIEAILKLQQNLFLCPTSFAQEGAIAAFEEDSLKYIESIKKNLNEKRKLVLSYLKQAKLDYIYPNAAFYVFVNIKRDSKKFCKSLLLKKKVALTPGSGFGPGNETYIRISYATSFKDLEEGLKRFISFLS
ncbi:MAG TPA: aminotransferase class I/II-fold pyridoxal phosphate-dependent enzyme [Desulfurobacteriaceae bacterium]|nr:aminotransferase class I/II-fold pyridoxal phosphate-dependent enzyme [Desulfurobacteriaceae bacterium]